MPHDVSVSLPHPADVQIGVVPLRLDAARLILAAEFGHFAACPATDEVAPPQPVSSPDQTNDRGKEPSDASRR